MLGLKALIWSDTPEVLYRDIGGAKQLCSEFRFTVDKEPGYKGELGFICFDGAGHFTVAPGYTWDGASGPTLDTVNTVCASLGHDVLYELMGAGLLSVAEFKEPADFWFYRRLLTDGVASFRAWAWYKAVQVCGVPKQGDDDIVKRAPIPFPKEAKPTIEVIPGYRIPA
jgi:hypothetical protein